MSAAALISRWKIWFKRESRIKRQSPLFNFGQVGLSALLESHSTCPDCRGSSSGGGDYVGSTRWGVSCASAAGDPIAGAEFLWQQVQGRADLQRRRWGQNTAGEDWCARKWQCTELFSHFFLQPLKMAFSCKTVKRRGFSSCCVRGFVSLSSLLYFKTANCCP